MLAEALIAARGFSIAKMFMGGRGYSGGGGGGSSGGGNTFMKGGLSGVVSRRVTNNAVKNANGTKSGGIGGAAFNSSLSKGGGFANSVIGKIATGNMSTSGSISGATASDALMSYMGYTALGEGATDIPSFSDVEIGGGHIFATETSDEHPEGIAIGMYHADQYMKPDGNYTTVTAADGTSWYKQYATDPQYFQVCAWNEDARRLVNANAKQGSLIWISGSLELEPYTKQDGITIDKRMKIMLDNWGFIPTTRAKYNRNSSRPKDSETTLAQESEVVDGDRDSLPG